MRWRVDGESYATTQLVDKIKRRNELREGGTHGPQFWKVPDRRTLVEVADALLAARKEPKPPVEETR